MPALRTYTSDVRVKGRLYVDGGILASSGGEVNVKAPPYNATGNGVTDDTVALQAAITACPLYGTVLLPPGQYVISDTLQLTKAIVLRGLNPNSPGGATISAISTMSSLKDVLHLAPGVGQGTNYQLADFAIGRTGGSPCRHAIYLDAAAESIEDVQIRNVRLYALNTTGRAIFADGSGSTSDGNPVISTIEQCHLEAGIEFASCGDTVRILNNRISGALEALKVSFQTGASTLIVRGNSMTNTKGIAIGTGAVATQIVENEFETFAAFTGSNGAFLDIAGTTGSHAREVMVARNSFQMVNGVAAHCIRVDFGDRCYIQGNRLDRGTAGSKDILVTANATNTVIGHNMWSDGTPLTDMVGDSGTGTVVLSAFGGHIWATGIPAFANNAAALAGGLLVGQLYRTGADPDPVMVVH